MRFNVSLSSSSSSSSSSSFLAFAQLLQQGRAAASTPPILLHRPTASIVNHHSASIDGVHIPPKYASLFTHAEQGTGGGVGGARGRGRGISIPFTSTAVKTLSPNQIINNPSIIMTRQQQPHPASRNARVQRALEHALNYHSSSSSNDDIDNTTPTPLFSSVRITTVSLKNTVCTAYWTLVMAPNSSTTTTTTIPPPFTTGTSITPSSALISEMGMLLRQHDRLHLARLNAGLRSVGQVGPLLPSKLCWVHDRVRQTEQGVEAVLNQIQNQIKK